MALIRSTILSEVRGSINGTTFARNRYGAYARNRTVPVNPQTASQQATRQALAQSTQQWRDLSAGNKLLWSNYAAETPVLNRLGETIILSGQAMWNKYAIWSLTKGLAITLQPPTSPGLALTLTPSLVEIDDSASALPNTIITTYSNGATTITAQYPVWISPPQSAGTTFYKGPWIYLGLEQGTTRGDPYTVPFQVTAGQSFFTKYGYRDATLPQGKLGGDAIFGPTLAVNAP